MKIAKDYNNAIVLSSTQIGYPSMQCALKIKFITVQIYCLRGLKRTMMSGRFFGSTLNRSNNSGQIGKIQRSQQVLGLQINLNPV